MSDRGGPLSGQRILVVGRDYFFYTRAIVAELQAAQGAEVTYVSITPENNWYRVLKRWPGAARSWLERFHRRQIAQLSAHAFETVLFIQVHQLSHDLVSLYRRSFAGSRFVLYYWDSLLTHDYRPYLPYFDEAWTFDPADARREPRLKLLPLFFCEGFEALRERNEFRHDLAFVGTAMSLRRYDRIVECRRLASTQGVVLFDYVYVSPLFYLRTLLGGRRLRGVHFRPLSGARLLAVYDSARAVLDLPENIQSGYTMRTFESLGAYRKLVTTRQDIVGQNFFDESSVFVLGLHGAFPTRGFLQSKTRPVTGIDRYALREWLLVLLGTALAPSTPPHEQDKALESS
jgi:hypothetical protein